MNKRGAFYRGMAALMAFLLFVSATGANLALNNDSMINSSLGISTTTVITEDGEETETAYYYENDYGYDEDALVDIYTDAAAVNVETEEEAIVLLRNEDDALPLDPESTQLTIFGAASVNTAAFYSTSTVSYLDAVTFVEAMEDEFGADNVNSVLCTEVYASLGNTSQSTVVEADIESVKAYEDTWQDEYNDVAVVVFTRDGSEGNDLSMYSSTDTYEDGTARRFLDLSQNEEDLIEYLCEQRDAGVFDKIVVIFGTDFDMEMEWLEEYDIDAAILTGETGTFGCTAVAEVLAGEVNPSGRLVDTYAANSLSAPATVNAAENNYQWTNSDEVNEAVTNENDSDGANIDNYVIYAEGIYVGYKYYETRYEDTVMGTGNADGTAGSSTGESWTYEDEVTFTFGYGLSYTEFEQTLDSVEYDEDLDSYIVTVTVTNTGSVAGKDVVEVYAQTPYGDYEIENLVEKSSVMLVAYDKTDTLEPGESQTLTIEVMRYFLASYDTYGYETYILSAGDYYLAIGSDAHDALNNILAAKGYSTSDGMTADGDASKTYTWNLAEIDAETYSTSIYTGVEVTNLFEETDINYYGYDITYLTRNDWEGTYPEAEILEATQAIIDGLNANYDYETPEDAPSVDDFTQGADNGIVLSDLIGLDYDDELWDEFIDQMTVEQMAYITAEDISMMTVDELEIVGITHGDDNQMMCGSFTWISEPTTSRTWDVTYASLRGEYGGLIAFYEGSDCIYYGGGNLHRTPFGGRANQYYSEDSVMGYWQGYYEAEAMQAVGCIYCIKHLVLNDQETNRQGLNTFANEQSIRETYLRAFEGAFAGGALSVMTSTARMGVQGAKSYEPLLTDWLRGEIGFLGNATSDGYTTLGYYQNILNEVTAGMDYSCIDFTGAVAEVLIETINEDEDGYILETLREMTHRNLYVMTHTARMNSLASGGTVVTTVPTWEIVLMVENLVVAILFVVFLVLAIVEPRRKRSKSKAKQD